MPPLTHAACPVDGARLFLVSSTNGAGDDIHRYACPTADWFGPWFSGDPTGEIHLAQLPEVTRSATFVAAAPAAGGGSSPTGFANAALTTVPANVASVTLLASNSARRGAFIYNEGTAILKLAFAAVASATAFTITLTGNALYEFQFPMYTGIVTGIWDAATGNARITEVS